MSGECDICGQHPVNGPCDCYNGIIECDSPGRIIFCDKPPDMVDHPQHYARWKMEPIEFVAINNLPWWLHAVIKYTMRYDAKDGLKDMYKARSYLEMKIRQLEGVKRFWEKPVAEERKANRLEQAVESTVSGSCTTGAGATTTGTIHHCDMSYNGRHST